ncbi:hypothetical protein GCM10010994_39120 [Chelatococcus reniformis]|uniref:Uncharacterized protein n=1 Tax=Chelatococcus reniformis TaxID=1494448 RepID=A0A916XJ20_9HYPH|nr:hypothetical protein GCM10010994_39120 [Chelatococcus reniformis]
MVSPSLFVDLVVRSWPGRRSGLLPGGAATDHPSGVRDSCGDIIEKYSDKGIEILRAC